MSDRVFVDTNILVYAEDLDDRRHEVARQLVERLWETGDGVLSVQVLQEFFTTVTRKLKRPYPLAAARSIVAEYLHWEVVENDGALLLAAIDLQAKHKLSFWDALVVQAAVKARVTTLLSEDLNHGQLIEGVRIHCPF
jgi:predicted nucleic acid-binding protein